jgi:hypothetical protein
MEIKFADSFWESLDRMVKRERWYWKTWDFLRYDIPKGINNIIFFWKVIWNFRPWDSSYSLKILGRSLEKLKIGIENGNEVDITRLKKVEKIGRSIEIIKNITEDLYHDIAEDKLGYEINTEYIFRDEPSEISEANRKIYDLSREIGEKEWNELWEIFKGQNHNHYVMLLDRMDEEKRKDEDVWGNWYDGSGMRQWWE